jgi:N-methylhydantoinase A
VIVGVDIGGTFTDFVLVDEKTNVQVHHKVSSTPHDPALAVLKGLEDLQLAFSSFERVIHGTTVATNTIIQRSGAATGIITTVGHRDALEIRRGIKPEAEVFDTLWRQPEPLVPRYLRLDIDERLDYRGRELLPVDRDQLAAAAGHLAEHGVEAVAICFLFSYLDGNHEHEAARWLQEHHPEFELSLSSDILPQWREYERLATTVCDAYVKPRMKRYVTSLDGALRQAGFTRDLLIMKSNGGVMSAASAGDRPAETFLSGPAGGVIAAKYCAQLAGRGNVVTLDMGGTSCDVSLVTDGKLSTTTDGWVDALTPISLPMLDIRTVGAGGGSIAWVDSGRALKVGPRSAGAVPGPACYGLGGVDPTVTDANVVLGRLGSDTLLGGRLHIDPERASHAIEDRICSPLGIELTHAAAGIILICVANMAKEIRALTAERGVDARDYALVAGGGGGPLHAAAIAREFGITNVVVPAFPGLLSAGGLILSDLRIDRLRSFPCRIERDGVVELQAEVAALMSNVVSALEREGFTGVPQVQVSLDMRYLGQNWDINVPVTAELTADDISAAFDMRHDQLYGFALSNHAHEVLSIRASAVGPTADAAALIPRRSLPRDPVEQDVSDPAAVAPRRWRNVWDDDAETFRDTAIYAWEDLRVGLRIPGPAIIEGMDSTIWAPSTSEVVVGSGGDLSLLLSTTRVSENVGVV